MKSFFVFLIFAFSLFAFAQEEGYSGQLKPEDQKFYKNESGAGLNQLERIDSSVKEINKLHGELAALKSEVAALKKEVAELKGKK